MSAERTGLGIRPDGTTEWVVLGYQGLHDFIGVIDFKRVRGTPSDFGVYLDDEGMLWPDRVLNTVATLLVGYPLYGQVVIVAADTDDAGDSLPPPEWIVSVAEGLAQMWHIAVDAARDVGQDIVTIHPDPDTVPGPTIYPLTREGFNEWLETGGFRHPSQQQQPDKE